MPGIGNIDWKDEASCLDWTINIGSREVGGNFETDTDKLNNVVYRK